MEKYGARCRRVRGQIASTNILLCINVDDIYMYVLRRHMTNNNNMKVKPFNFHVIDVRQWNWYRKWMKRMNSIPIIILTNVINQMEFCGRDISFLICFCAVLMLLCRRAHHG